MDKAQPFISNDSGGLFCGKVDLRGKKINLDDPLCRLSVTVIFASLRRHRNGNVWRLLATLSERTRVQFGVPRCSNSCPISMQKNAF